MSYQITEPHPSVPSSHYVLAGRGGAGNIKHLNPSTVTPGPDAQGPASRAVLTPPPSNAYYLCGRGGAGNIHRQKERAIFSFDEELARQRKILDHQAPVYHVGRGGAGNLVDEMHPRASRGSADSNMTDGSTSSRTRRSIEGAWGKVSRTFSRV